MGNALVAKKKSTVKKSFRLLLLSSLLLCIFALSSNVYAQNDLHPEALNTIQDNVHRINEKTDWTRIEIIAVEESTEGGEVAQYWSGDYVEKVVVRHFGETYQVITEFFALNGKLSFVFEKTFRYNRPFYYDSTAMAENNDTEYFDFEKSEIREIRSYVVEGVLVEHLDSNNPDAEFSTELLSDKATELKSDWNRYNGLAGSERLME